MPDQNTYLVRLTGPEAGPLDVNQTGYFYNTSIQQPLPIEDPPGIGAANLVVSADADNTTQVYDTHLVDATDNRTHDTVRAVGSEAGLKGSDVYDLLVSDHLYGVRVNSTTAGLAGEKLNVTADLQITEAP